MASNTTTTPQPHPKLVIIRRKTTVETVEEVPVVMDCAKRAGFIYEIYNDVNDMVYVGSTNDMKRRFSDHKSKSMTRTSKFYTAMREIGFDNFHMRCLEEFRYTDDDELVKREFEHIAEYEKERLYNTNTMYGVVSDETKAKMSASHLGKALSDETKDKISTSQLGKKLTDETKSKISASLLGKKKTDEHKSKISKVQQRGGCISVRANDLQYTYRKDGRKRSKCFSFGPRSNITQEEAMILALAYQRETFPGLFGTEEEDSE